MALSQDRYISIKSTNVGDSAVQQRELGGLAFTLGKGWKKTDEPWDDGMKVIIYGATQARNYFVDGSAEIKEAERYFSYISPSGTAPSSLTYVKMSVKAAEDDGEYAVVASVSKMTSSKIKEVSVNKSDFLTKIVKPKNATYSFEYQNTSWTYGGNNINLSDFGITVTCDPTSGTPASGDVIKVVVSNQLVWKKSNSTEGWYKIDDASMQVSSPIVETPNAALHRVNADSNNFGSYNFIDIDQFTCGQFKDVAISNCGFNYKYHFCVACVDGQTTDAGDDVKMDKVSTAIMNLFLTTEKIPANADGELMIYGILMSAAEQGVRNGMILRGKRLTDEQKVKVYQLTGNSEAWFTVQDTGYVGSVEIRQKDKKYVAYYKLIYSKGDAICKVEGSDILI